MRGLIYVATVLGVWAAPVQAVRAAESKLYPVSAAFFQIYERVMDNRLQRAVEVKRRGASDGALTSAACAEINKTYRLSQLDTRKLNAEEVGKLGLRITGEIFVALLPYIEDDVAARQRGEPLTEAQKLKRLQGNRQSVERLRQALKFKETIAFVQQLAAKDDGENGVAAAIAASPLGPGKALQDQWTAVEKATPMLCTDEGEAVANADYAAEPGGR